MRSFGFRAFVVVCLCGTTGTASAGPIVNSDFLDGLTGWTDASNGTASVTSEPTVIGYSGIGNSGIGVGPTVVQAAAWLSAPQGGEAVLFQDFVIGQPTTITAYSIGYTGVFVPGFADGIANGTLRAEAIPMFGGNPIDLAFTKFQVVPAWAGAAVGYFDAVLPSAGAWRIEFIADGTVANPGSPYPYQLSISNVLQTPVPEPSAFAIAVLGLMSAGIAIKRCATK